MKTRQTLAVVFALGLLPVVLNCECEETGSLILDEASMDHYYIGDTEVPPGISNYADTAEGADPDEGEITVDFGRVDVESITHKYLMIRNTGTAELKIVGVTWDVTDPSFVIACFDGSTFAVGCDYTPGDYLTIPSNSDLIMKITYTPMEVASHTAEFLIESNAIGFPNVRVTLLGQGVTPEIEVCISNCEGDQEAAGCQDAVESCDTDVAPDNLTIRFGEAVVGDDVNRLVVIRNRGDQSLNVQTPLIMDGDVAQFRFQVTDGEVPGVIAADGEAVLIVSYQPTKGGEHTATLQIISDDVNKREVNLHLNGKGLAPRVCPEPILLDFGNVTVGEPSEMFFTLSNCGLLDLTVDDIRLNEESSPDFSLVTLPGLPLTLAPEASVEIHVLYSPGERGSDHGGVDIYSNDPTSDPDTGKTGTVELRGNGVVKECQIQPIPISLNFGGVVQQQSDTMILVLSNQGTATCRIDSVEIIQNSADNEFLILAQPVDGTTFDPGDVVMPQVEVQYAPTALGMDNGKLKITGNDADGPEIIVDLIGEGVLTAECDLQVTPSSLNFGTVKLNATKSMVITAKNDGNAACTVDDIELIESVTFPSDFELTMAPNVPFTVARRGQPGDQVEIEITMAPTQLDIHKAVFWLHTPDDPDIIAGEAFCFKPGFPPVPPGPGDACVSITGMSAESDIEVVPAELDFGVVTVGCNSPELHITVYNLGTLDLTVNDIYLEDPADPNFEIMYAPATPYVLYGGSSFEVRMRYHPQDLSAHRNTLYLQSDASNVDLLAVPLLGRGTDISDQVDVFHQPTEVKSDVLFVIDNSGSMIEEQNALASNFSHFIQHTTTLDVDYHIGVIATEVNDPETGLGSPARDVIPGVLVHPESRPKIISNSTPDPEGAFSDNVRIGTCCSDEQEAGLEAAWMALSPPLVDDPAQNGGFLREDAKLYIICVSDEQDQSKGTPDFYVDFFSSIKGYHNTDMMKVSAVVGDCPGGCGGEQAACGSRYIDVANRTGGIFESICTSNWAQALENLGIDAFAAIREFPLSRPADASTIVVTVNGVVVGQAGSQGGADGWTYYPDTNSIYFGDTVVPDRGDRIEVQYTAACL